MASQSKMIIEKFLDINTGQYDLGVVPNIIIDSFIHNINFSLVTKQIVARHKHKENYKKVLDEMIYNGVVYFENYDLEMYENQLDDYENFEQAHNWFVQTYGTFEENPDAYAFYNDLVYGV